MLIAFNKPYGILSQFSPDGSRNGTLAQFQFPPRIYPIGRLDADSEGLLLLSDEPAVNERLLHPKNAHIRRYWVQVERTPAPEAMSLLSRGVKIQGRLTLPCKAWIIEQPTAIPPRIPPIRFRKTVETSWIALELIEGRNRQVRRMTAAVGHPTLRLIRCQIGKFELGTLARGNWRVLSSDERELVFA